MWFPILQLVFFISAFKKVKAERNYYCQNNNG